MIFKQFTTNEIKATGWLRNQLEIQADVLPGNHDKMWNSVKESSWIGRGLGESPLLARRFCAARLPS